MSREKENQTLSSRLAESQDAVCQLKQLVENHVASEREKNKRVSIEDPSLQYMTFVTVFKLHQPRFHVAPPSDRRPVTGGGEAERRPEQPVAALVQLCFPLQETAAEPAVGDAAAANQTTAVPAGCMIPSTYC